jgi:hypothetical protein
MVSGAGGDHAPIQFLPTEAGHFVECPPQLEAEDGLEVFPLEQDPVAEPGREVGGRIERRFNRDVVDPGAQDALQEC